MFKTNKLTSTIANVSKLAGLSALVIGSTAIAQEKEKGGHAVEEIIVTANRRESTLQDTASSISALSGEKLQSMGAKSLSDFYRTIPGLSFVDRGVGRNSIIIRGISVDAQDSQIPTTGVYLDDTAIGGPFSNPNLRIYDVDRVEVLRGPQGTLYGASSLGGAIRYISKQPDSNEFGGYYDISGNSIKGGETAVSGNGAVNLPLIEDTLGLRISAYRDEEKGFIDNYGSIANYATGATTAPVQENVGGSVTKGGRVTLGWTPIDELSVRFGYVYQKTQGSGQPDVERVTTFGADDTPVPANRLSTFSDLRAFTVGNEDLNDEVKIATLTVDYDLDWSQLTYAFSDFKYDNRFGSVDNNNRLAGQGIGFSDLEDGSRQVKSHELRLVSSYESPLQWVAGTYYAQDEGTSKSFGFGTPGYIQASGGDPALIAALGLPAEHQRFSSGDGKTTQYAFFGEVTYDFTEQWQVTIGARHAKWKQQQLGFTEIFANEFLTGGAFEGYTAAQFAADVASGDITTDAYRFSDPATAANKNSTTTLKLNVAYRPTDDTLVFAQASQGFRLVELGVNRQSTACINNPASGLNGRQPADQKSDDLWNYELGVKSSFFDGRLTGSAGIYLIDWTNIQFEGELPAEDADGNDTDCRGILPNGDARTKGFEFEMAFAATDNLNLSLNGAYTDARVAKVPAVRVKDGTSEIALPLSTVDVVGTRVGTRLSTPKTTYSFSADYSLEEPVIADFNGNFHIDYSYTSAFYNNLDVSGRGGRSPRLKNDTVGLVNMSFGLERDGLSATLAVNNVFDKLKSTFTTANQRGTRTSYSVTTPRSVVLSIRQEF